MRQDESKDRFAGLSKISRKLDRRFCTKLSPPPYPTSEGVILNDRRCYIDRRASWIKEFFMNIGDKDHG